MARHKQYNSDIDGNLFGNIPQEDNSAEQTGPVTVLGLTFADDEERRAYFRAELRAKLPELRQIEGFPIGSDDDIINLSDPPYYTACPNPWLNDFIAEWEQEKKQLEADGKRREDFVVREPYALPVKEKKSNSIYTAHSYHTKVPPEIILKYLLHYTQPGDIIIDNFAGTGMAGVACQLATTPDDNTKERFNKFWQINFNSSPNWGVRHAILGDLSPIASFITYNYNNFVDAKEFSQIANSILEQLKSELGYTYELTTKEGPGIINYIVWSEIQICPNCNESFVYWDTAVDMNKDSQLAEYPCPHCGHMINKRNSLKFFTTQFDELINNPVKLCSFVPVFVNYTVGKRRIERNLTLEERLSMLKVVDSLRIDTAPIRKLEDGDKTGDPINIGVEYVHQFYSRRNLSILLRFKQLINEAKCDGRMKLFLGALFTSCQSRLHRMNRYAPKHHRHVGPLANTLYISATPTEISPFYFISSKIKENTVKIANGHNIINQIASAVKSTISDNSIDYIFTDPPFGANIMYSELNIITESWLNLFTNNSTEAICNNTQNKHLVDYLEIMTLCFKEYYRILKPGKWITIEFSNTSNSVWNAIQTALNNSGFIISSVADLDKGRGGLHGIVGPTAVDRDLAISCFKPSDGFVNRLTNDTNKQNVWDFIDELLKNLPVHIEDNNLTIAIRERYPKKLFDSLIAFFVLHNIPVPLDSKEFQDGLRERFLERDGMFFTADQAFEYEAKKKETTGFEAAQTLFVSSEAEGIEWLKRELQEPKTYADLTNPWNTAQITPRKGDRIPELKTILEENFIEDEDGRWRVPDPEKEADLEKIRNRRLAHEFKLIVEEANKPKSRIRDARLEALRYGFTEAYRAKDFETIVKVAHKLPEALVMEDEVLLRYYDIAINHV